jgi:hypothetical protein
MTAPLFVREAAMPVISMFYGVIIRMYLLDTQNHNLPHLHARYAEFEASIGLDDGEILAGQIPRKQLRLVQAGLDRTATRRTHGRLGARQFGRVDLQDRTIVR